MREDSKREPGTIVSVWSGREDHDILTCSIRIDFKGSTQAFGNICLNEELLPSFVQDICNTFSVNSLDELEGKQCYALRCFGFWNDLIEGLESMDGKRFTLTSWRKKHFSNVQNPLQHRINSLKSDYDSHIRRANSISQELKEIEKDYTDWG